MADENPEQDNRAQNQPVQKGSSTEPEPTDPRNKSRRRYVVIGLVAILAVGAFLFWWHSTYYENTDDAQISGNLIQISSRIAGHVIEVKVEENQYVDKGTVIAVLDPTDFQTAVQQDEANLASAEAAYEAAKVSVPVTHINTGATLSSAGANLSGARAGVAQAEKQLQAAVAAVAQAKANSVKSQQDLERYTPLVEKDVISRQQYDAAVAAAQANKAAVAQAEANLQGAQDAVHIAHDRVSGAQAGYHNAQTGPQQVAIQQAKADEAAARVQQAKAALEQAKLNQSYTKIIAPDAGIITRKSVQVGQNVSVGQNLMTLVSLDNIWVTANFKETQLDHMRAGQPVVISVDAYGGRKYDGRVTQIGGATGSELSLFPPENATGNYVKVVQRVPVRIDFTKPSQIANHLLRPGMSVEPRVRVKK
ncbi:MAG TPA: HlyD family secretion protein [Acidobacteriaceae bacterium]|nr:HlyD family secretion protein [Acidobacteriaceae bacterium]